METFAIPNEAQHPISSFTLLLGINVTGNANNSIAGAMLALLQRAHLSRVINLPNVLTISFKGNYQVCGQMN